MPTAPAKRSAPTRKWQCADHQQRQRIVVETAVAMLQKQGLEAVTMRRVAARLGVGAMTLYTYVDGQRGLHRAMVRRGFEMLGEGCENSREAKAANPTAEAFTWRPGAENYLRFAVGNPNLFRLMFDTPLPQDDDDLLRAGFQPLLECVAEQLAEQRGLSGDVLRREANTAAGRYWIALHGLAMLAISGRLVVLNSDIDTLLDDILPRVAPSAAGVCPVK